MEDRLKQQEKARRKRKRLITLLVLCTVLPPVGMLLMWRSTNRTRAKVLFSVYGTLLLMLMISGILRLMPAKEIEVTTVPAGYLNTQLAPQTTPEPEDYYYQPPEYPEEDPDDIFVAPANPNE